MRRLREDDDDRSEEGFRARKQRKQRPCFSCAECRRLKMKCDRQEAGIVLQCRAPIVFAATASSFVLPPRTQETPIIKIPPHSLDTRRILNMIRSKRAWVSHPVISFNHPKMKVELIPRANSKTTKGFWRRGQLTMNTIRRLIQTRINRTQTALITSLHTPF
ncbi:hypothetical protein CEP51_010571 [Fusarium floridanum]|uniref:Zn(2)-C6 fungal-type domain-containing protein n=1 Tax=Fusarium floridanum TaxID=1325733 RepID=A0A428RDZ7_9HYPO|nr:hypothetical protein CEP51_010571 [Fusarium floridanum]